MKKIPVWKNVVLIISVLVIIMIATFAWFYTGPNGTVEELVMRAGKANYIQISGNESNKWQEDLNVEISINVNFKEMSGNGSRFFVPVYEVPKDAADGKFFPQLSFTEVGEGKENEYYYEQTLDFRADSVQNVYLDPQSFVTVDDPEKTFIDGAIRMAFFELDEAGNETLKLIWAPNSNVEYSSETNLFTREGSVEPHYYYQKTKTFADTANLAEANVNVAVIPTADKTDEAGCGYDPNYKFMWTGADWQELPDGALPVLTVNGSGEEMNLFYKRLIVRVWLEGHDRDCVSLLSGQKFRMKLHFTAQEVE